MTNHSHEATNLLSFFLTMFALGTEIGAVTLYQQVQNQQLALSNFISQYPGAITRLEEVRPLMTEVSSIENGLFNTVEIGVLVLVVSAVPLILRLARQYQHSNRLDKLTDLQKWQEILSEPGQEV